MLRSMITCFYVRYAAFLLSLSAFFRPRKHMYIYPILVPFPRYSPLPAYSHFFLLSFLSTFNSLVSRRFILLKMFHTFFLVTFLVLRLPCWLHFKHFIVRQPLLMYRGAGAMRTT